MATSSLGRLTLDLLVKLAGFEQGLDAAERKAKKSSENMKQAFAGFKEQISDALGGTQIGSVIDGLNTKLDSLSGGVAIAGAAFAGMAVGGVVASAGALTTMAIETAKANNELQVLANRANTSLQSFQVLQYAASSLGITQDQLGSILADTQEKLGEFSATQGGGAADFFDALKNNTKMTEAQIKSFSKTLQGKDGIEAIQLLNNKMDELGVTSQERRFIFESLASDLSNLAPIFAENGRALDAFDEALRQAGLLTSKEAAEQSQLLAAQVQAVNLQFQGWKNQLVTGFMPALTDVANAFFSTSKNGQQLQSVGSGIGSVMKAVAKVGLGVSATFTIAGKVIGGVAAAIAALKGDKIATINLMFDDIEQTLADYGTRIDSLSITGDSATKSTNNLVNAILDVNQASRQSAQGLALDTKTADENAKAAEKQAAAKAKLNKELQVNAQVQANAAKFGFASLESQYKLPSGLLSAINMQESRGNANAIGPQTKYGTAKGGFQFLDGTAKRFGLLGDDVFNTGKSAEAAAKYFQVLYEKFGSWDKAISAYHAGEGNVERGTGLGPINREYVKNVMGYMDSALKGVGSTASDAVQYVDEILRSQRSVIQNYLTEREKLEIDHVGKLKAINDAFAGDSSAIQKYTDLQNAAYKKDVTEYESQQKLKEIAERKTLLEVRKNWMTAGNYAQEYYALVREEILATAEYSPDMKHALIKETNLNQGMDQNAEREQTWSDYQNRFEAPNYYQQDADLLKAARDQMLITEEEFQSQRLRLQAAYGSQYAADFAGMLMGVVDESSSAYAILGGIQKGAALFSTAMNSYTAISAAWASAPFPYNLPAVAMATMETGLLQAAVSALSPVGYANGGFTGYGGKYEPAGIVHRGEGVLTQEEIAALGGPAGFFALRQSIKNGFADGGLALDAPKVLNMQSPSMSGYMQQAQQSSQANVNLNPNFVIVDDRQNWSDYLFGPDGSKAFVKFFKRNRTALGV